MWKRGRKRWKEVEREIKRWKEIQKGGNRQKRGGIYIKEMERDIKEVERYIRER